MGLRRMLVNRKFVEQLLVEGTARAVPVAVPRDLEIQGVGIVPGGLVEVLVASKEWPDTEQPQNWVPEYRTDRHQIVKGQSG